MFLQILPVHPEPRSPWSPGFNHLWRTRVLGLPSRIMRFAAPAHPSDQQLWQSYRREHRVEAIIPAIIKGTRIRIGWGPSPSGLAIQRGHTINARDAHQKTTQRPWTASGKRKKQKFDARILSPEQIALTRIRQAAQRDADGNMEPLLLFESPSAEHPRGRGFIVAIARQYPERFNGIWKKLSFRQRMVTLAYFGETGGTMKEVGERHGMSEGAVRQMLSRANKLIAGAGLPELMQAKVREGTTINYSAYQLEHPE